MKSVSMNMGKKNPGTEEKRKARKMAKDYLSQAFWLECRVNNKEAMLSSLNDMAKRITRPMKHDPVPGNRDPHKWEEILVKIADMEREIQDEIAQLVDLKAEIMHTIRKIGNRKYQALLEMRYLCFMDWNEIARELNYCDQNVYRMHREALDAVRIPGRGEG